MTLTARPVCPTAAPPSRVSSRFSSDRSRWATPRSCSHLTAVQICAAIGRICRSRASPSSGPPRHQENRSPSVASEVTAYMAPEPAKTPWSRQAYGYPMLFRCLRRPRSTHGFSEAPGWQASNSAWLPRVQLRGIFLTATARPPAERSLIITTQPWLRAASCNLLANTSRRGSYSVTLSATSRMHDCSRASVSWSSLEAGCRPLAELLAELLRARLGPDGTGGVSCALRGGPPDSSNVGRSIGDDIAQSPTATGTWSSPQAPRKQKMP
mmetsp:Transcript_72258/g.204819  ORF Transcript_72258/g.204819 Transcript_72258/m.204819 type:complete len:268 (+) Transcript_72258:531-1334(+)